MNLLHHWKLSMNIILITLILIVWMYYNLFNHSSLIHFKYFCQIKQYCLEMHIWVIKLLKYKEVITVNTRIVDTLEDREGLWLGWGTKRSSSGGWQHSVSWPGCQLQRIFTLAYQAFTFSFCIHVLFYNKTIFLWSQKKFSFCCYYK